MAEGIDARAIWQSQPVEGYPLSFGALREKADTLRWQARWRVLSGYGWGGFLAIKAGFGMAAARNGMGFAGNLLCILGAVLLAVWWRRFAIRADMRHDLPMRACLVAFREEAVRQQRLARSLGVWSVLPLVGGLVIAGAGHLSARHALNARSLAVMAALGLLVIGLGWVFGRLHAEQLQFRVDEVDAALQDQD
jgi:hypothetical protein